MKKIIFIHIIILLFHINIYSNNIIPYNSELLEDNYKNWIKPYQFYFSGRIDNIISDKIEINLGVDDGVEEGFVYNVLRKNQHIARVVISTVKNEYSIAYAEEKNRTIFEGDKIEFTNTIKISENDTYLNRMHKKITSKVTFVDESGLCFLQYQKNSGIEIGMIFDVINDDGKITGIVEILDNTGKDNLIIAIITETKTKIEVGNIAVKKPWTLAQWEKMGDKFEKQKDFLNAIYCYEMALKMTDGTSRHLQNKLFVLVALKAKEYEKNEMYDKSLKIRKKIYGFSNETDMDFNNTKDKVLQLAREYWNARRYLKCIKYYELLEQDEQVVKYLSFSYNGLGKDVYISNQEKALYCFLRSTEIMPSNVNAWKNLAEYYEQNKNFQEALKSLNEMLKHTEEAVEKNWITDKINELKSKEQNIVSNIIFQNFTGSIVTLRNLRGKAVLIVVWSRNHLDSDDNLYFLDAFFETNKSNNIEIIIVNKEELDENVILKYFEEKQIKNIKPYKPLENISTIFQSRSMADKVFSNTLIDPKGRIIYQKNEIFDNELETLIKGLE